MGEQLKQALLKNAGRVMDLFREWDEDGDGQITRKEFRAAMLRMGLEVPLTPTLTLTLTPTPNPNP